MQRLRAVICKGFDCRRSGSDSLFEAVRRAMADNQRCRVVRGGCFGQCHEAPNVLIQEDQEEELSPLSGSLYGPSYEPAEQLLSQATAEDVTRALESSLARATSSSLTPDSLAVD